MKYILCVCLILLNSLQHRHSKHDHLENKKVITADRKVILVLCHYLFFHVEINVIHIIQAIPNNQFATNAYKYFYCESKGQDLCAAPSDLIYPITEIVNSVVLMTVPLLILCTMTPVQKVTNGFKMLFSAGKS